MTDGLSPPNSVIREALALAPTDPASAISLLKNALDTATIASHVAALAQHAGAICQGTGDTLRAIEFYRRAATANPSAFIHLALGQLCRQVGLTEDAREALSACLNAINRGDERDLLEIAKRELAELNLP